MLRLLNQVWIVFLKLLLFAHKVIINDNLLFNEVLELFTYGVGTLDTFIDGCVSCLEFIESQHDLVEVTVLEQVLAVLRIILCALKLILNLVDLRQKLVNTQSLLEDNHLLQEVCVLALTILGEPSPMAF